MELPKPKGDTVAPATGPMSSYVAYPEGYYPLSPWTPPMISALGRRILCKSTRWSTLLRRHETSITHPDEHFFLCGLSGANTSCATSVASPRWKMTTQVVRPPETLSWYSAVQSKEVRRATPAGRCFEWRNVNYTILESETCVFKFHRGPECRPC